MSFKTPTYWQDDNQTNLYYLKELFANFDIVIDYAEDGESAVNRCFEKVATLFLWTSMPFMDGIQTTQSIRANCPKTGSPLLLSDC